MIPEPAPTADVRFDRAAVRPLYSGTTRDGLHHFEVGERADGWWPYVVFGGGWAKAGACRDLNDARRAVTAAIVARNKVSGNRAADKEGAPR